MQDVDIDPPQVPIIYNITGGGFSTDSKTYAKMNDCFNTTNTWSKDNKTYGLENLNTTLNYGDLITNINFYNNTAMN